MNATSKILLNILNISASCRSHQSVLLLVPIEDMVLNAFSEIVPPAATQQCTTLLSACMEENQEVENEDWDDFAAQVQAGLIQYPSADDGLDYANRSLEELLIIFSLMNSSYVHSAQLRLGEVSVFDYIQTFHGRQKPDGPQTILVGRVPSSYQKLQIPLDDRDLLLKRLKIAYVSDSEYPRLTVDYSSSSSILPAAPKLSDWIQKDSSDYDIDIFHRSSFLGKIYTRHIRLPFTILLGRVNLIIPEVSNVSLLSTKFLDMKGKAVIDCIKITRF